MSNLSQLIRPPTTQCTTEGELRREHCTARDAPSETAVRPSLRRGGIVGIPRPLLSTLSGALIESFTGAIKNLNADVLVYSNSARQHPRFPPQPNGHRASCGCSGVASAGGIATTTTSAQLPSGKGDLALFGLIQTRLVHPEVEGADCRPQQTKQQSTLQAQRSAQPSRCCRPTFRSKSWDPLGRAIQCGTDCVCRSPELPGGNQSLKPQCPLHPAECNRGSNGTWR